MLYLLRYIVVMLVRVRHQLNRIEHKVDAIQVTLDSPVPKDLELVVPVGPIEDLP